MKFLKYACVMLLALPMVSCNIYKKYELPTDNAVVNDYRKAVEAAPDPASMPYVGWRQIFTDPQLQSLIARALENNKDLDNARLNVDIARAQLKGAKLSYLPSLSLGPNGGTASYGGSHMDWSYSIPLSLNWEIDVFGKILNRKRGAQASLEMAEDYRAAAQSEIVCAVASTYYAIVMMQQQLDLTRRTAVIWEDQVNSMKLMKDAGMTNEAAVAQSESNYYSILASIPDLEAAIHETQNTMSLLLNTYPQTWEVTSSLDFDLPSSLADNIPISYLAVRPDVRAAERSFAVAYYATNSSLQAPKPQQQIALNEFQYSVLNASAQVSEALVKYHKNHEKRQQVEKQVEALEKSVECTQELFSFGQSTTYLEVLTARSGLLQAQLNSLACWHNKVSAIIELYKAVGGGR